MMMGFLTFGMIFIHQQVILPYLKVCNYIVRQIGGNYEEVRGGDNDVDFKTRKGEWRTLFKEDKKEDLQ